MTKSRKNKTINKRVPSHNKALGLTPARQEILQILQSFVKPLGAYAVLNEYKKRHPNAAPPTIYRALDFLTQQHLVHKIESLNAYVACNHNHESTVQFLVCTECGKTHETEAMDIGKNADKLAKKMGFVVKQTVLEIIGHCERCQKP